MPLRFPQVFSIPTEYYSDVEFKNGRVIKNPKLKWLPHKGFYVNDDRRERGESVAPEENDLNPLLWRCCGPSNVTTGAEEIVRSNSSISTPRPHIVVKEQLDGPHISRGPDDSSSIVSSSTSLSKRSIPQMRYSEPAFTVISPKSVPMEKISVTKRNSRESISNASNHLTPAKLTSAPIITKERTVSVSSSSSTVAAFRSVSVQEKAPSSHIQAASVASSGKAKSKSKSKSASKAKPKSKTASNMTHFAKSKNGGASTAGTASTHSGQAAPHAMKKTAQMPPQKAFSIGSNGGPEPHSHSVAPPPDNRPKPKLAFLAEINMRRID